MEDISNKYTAIYIAREWVQVSRRLEDAAGE